MKSVREDENVRAVVLLPEPPNAQPLLGPYVKTDLETRAFAPGAQGR